MDDWLKWRHNGLGASDAPAVMGVSPWKTRYQLWQEKCDSVIKNESNFITERGHRLEPRIRAHYELLNNIDMPPALVEHKDYSFIRASLDGWNEKTSTILEIKYCGQADFDSGVVPEKYWPQVQHQLLASGAARCHYFCAIADKNEHILGTRLIEVFPDLRYIQELLSELCAFWLLVQTKTPPELTAKDVKRINKKPPASVRS